MVSKAIQHQFEFWSHIGQVGGYFHKYDGFSSLSPKDATWPSKIFDLKENHIRDLKPHIATYHLAKSVALAENETLETLLRAEGFTQTSSVAAMSMNARPTIPYATYPEIEKITEVSSAKIFAKIASEAFGYVIYPNTILSLLSSSKIHLFLGKYRNQYVSCGLLFHDSNGDAGLHMIGAKKEYRGLGLGKKMTEHLLSIALTNDSEYVHLVASKLGAPIYYKLGFQNRGYLKSYTI
ncbi:GNAT family N-acetyltransferase [Spongiimicrobium salis]|uniref:GNAT family N-acetyltransferase n=1 Tax=Spongiimicrobium salis TaxID=1667022 RepID=UPI00374CD05B